MEKSKVDMFLAANANKFSPEMLVSIQEKLKKMSDDQYVALSMVNLWNPVLIIVIAAFFGWERFFLEDIGLGVLKVVTCQGMGIWWLVDIFTAKKRTHIYNYQKLQMVFNSIDAVEKESGRD